MNPAGSHFRIGEGGVHVWWIDLPRMTESDAVLSVEERARAARFHRPHGRQRWSAAHVALRQILALYTARAPDELRLESGVQGKPALLDEPSLCFNLTHAGDRAALAVAWQRETGIDLEPLAGDLPGRQDLKALLASACTPGEVAWIASRPPADRHGAFLKLWVLKEAYLKGIGAGLTVEPGTISLTPNPSPNEFPHPQPLSHRNGRGERDGEMSRQWQPIPTSPSPSPGSTGEGGRGVRARLGEEPMTEHHWTLRLLNPGPEWIAALAFAGSQPKITEYQWPLVAEVARTKETSVQRPSPNSEEYCVKIQKTLVDFGQRVRIVQMKAAPRHGLASWARPGELGTG